MTQQPYENPHAPASAVVQITLGEVFNEVRAMHQELRDLNSTLSPLKERVADHETRLRAVDGLPDDVRDLKKTVHEKHEVRLSSLESALPDNAQSRLRHLETRIAMYSGASGVLGAAAGYLASWVIYHH